MPQPAPGRNPKSRVHFTNPNARRQQEEKADMLRRNAHQQEIIRRAHEAKERKLQGKLDAVAQEVSDVFRPTAVKVLERATQGVEKGRVNKRLASTIILAVHEWFKEKTIEGMRSRKLPEELIKEIEEQHLQIISEEQYALHLANLLSANPSPKEQREVIESIQKWKTRVQRIAEGQYL